MGYIKKLVIHGFKSFASRTELPFDPGINVIIGPNGSGKSNISDALCFVLGRLSIKSMRAAKSANLLFQGSAEKKPCHEAFVELVFDNSDKMFPNHPEEVSIKRIVRKNGMSIYKINGETKTRQEMLELLSQVGIDPNGFNIVLQGEIARFIKMKGEERREIIEEVAGISIYESRKQKALSEIEKTEQKLKEVGAVLRERTIYMKNLENERKQALKFKELEQTVKQCKATIISKTIEEKLKEVERFEKDIEKNKDYKNKIKKEIELINTEILQMENRINEINQYIQKTTGFERETLNEEITDLNVKIASNKARKENFEKKISENNIRFKELENNIKELEKELEELKKQTPKMSKRQEDLKKKKQELEKVQDERDKFSTMQIEFSSLRNRLFDREKHLQKLQGDSKFIFNQIKEIEIEISSKSISECNESVIKIKNQIENLNKSISEIIKNKSELDKKLSISESEIEKNKNLKNRMPKNDICPLCQTKLTQEHVNHVLSYSDKRIKKSQEEIASINFELEKYFNKSNEINSMIRSLEAELGEKTKDLMKLNIIEDKKIQMKKIMADEEQIKKEIAEIQESRDKIEKKLSEKEVIEKRYQSLFFEMQELSSRTDENLDTTVLYKERELENMKNVIKNIFKDKKEIEDEIARLSTDLKASEKSLSEKEKASKLLSEKFNKLFDERTSIQEKIKNKNILLVNQQNGLNRVEESINLLKINQAGIAAAKESLEIEIKEFGEIELLQGSKASLQERLEKSERTLSEIGSVNLRALEMYDSIKEEYEKIAEKVEQLEKERDEILKIIHEIDIKKKKTFMKTFNSINELFTRNFSHLSVKGKAFLEIENKEDMFEGGVSITIKVSQGKYFDVTSLSGGEQTLIALSLIFAIQEYKPYCFYILDEIDAALDKRNSELLSNLLKQYMKSGQYLVISHNDSVISSANVLYGVSMNQGVSKVLSLKV
ncbi:MAG TPA: chromosome segregation SMC family protein [Candidatus Paceibacterota bacterium]|nr:chromosome segregation SMC family protein [Candidatus Paceibacterota bacterium]